MEKVTITANNAFKWYIDLLGNNYETYFIISFKSAQIYQIYINFL